MYAEVAWVLVSSGTQNQPQIIHDPDYLPDYLSVLMKIIVYLNYCDCLKYSPDWLRTVCKSYNGMWIIASKSSLNETLSTLK